MKRPTIASLKKVTAENLTGLGAERLAEILVSVAETRPELKRRLRMELAAEHGAEHLCAEIDKRLASLEISRGKITWRQRAAFIRDLDTLRALIAERLAKLDRRAALSRLWAFVGSARRVNSRLRDREGELSRVYERAAGDLGALLPDLEAEAAASALVAALLNNPSAWAAWLPKILEPATPDVAARALREISSRSGAALAWMPLIRQLADAAGDVDAYKASFAEDALRTPAVAAQVAERLLAADRLDEAGQILEASTRRRRNLKAWMGAQARALDPDYAWETVWIEYLERSGQGDAAQAARWASFERTLSVERAKAFTSKLDDFEDVEAENRAFAYAAQHPDFQAGLSFLMDWPALLAAAQMVAARTDEVVDDEKSELWAAKLRARYPAAAHQLLRKAAAAAFGRRDFKTCDRLTEEADAIAV